MKALDFYKTVIRDSTDFLDRLISLLEVNGIRYCVIRGQAVNAYAEPVVTLDLDLVVPTEQLEEARELLERHFHVREFEHSLNVSLLGSDLRVQIQRDPSPGQIVDRASVRRVLGIDLPVAAIEDVIAGKVRAAQNPARLASKQLKDLADIVRLMEVRPELGALVPEDVATRIASARAQE